MNRAQLRFLGFQHDTLAHQGGSQSHRDWLLRQIDNLAQEVILPRVGDRVVLARRGFGKDLEWDATITAVNPYSDRVEVSWVDERGHFGTFEQYAEVYEGDTRILRKAA